MNNIYQIIDRLLDEKLEPIAKALSSTRKDLQVIKEGLEEAELTLQRIEDINLENKLFAYLEGIN